MKMMLFSMIFILSCKKKGYNNRDLVLLTSYQAKDLCSCIFVQGRDEDFCRKWVKASPNVAIKKVDYENKVVYAKAFTYWTASAKWIDKKHGCVLFQK